MLIHAGGALGWYGRGKRIALGDISKFRGCGIIIEETPFMKILIGFFPLQRTRMSHSAQFPNPPAIGITYLYRNH